MKKLLLILIVIPAMFNVYSQDVSITDTEKKLTVYDIQRNSLYVEYGGLYLAAFYERSIPIGNKAGIIVGGGIIQSVGFSDDTNPVGKFAFMLGGYKHFFECGIGLAPLGNGMNILTPMVGYRYQSQGGFLLRLVVNLVTDSGTLTSGEEWTEAYPFPGLALGYSF